MTSGLVVSGLHPHTMHTTEGLFQIIGVNNNYVELLQ